MRVTLLLALLLAIVSHAYSQWPTSTLSDSALVINYGFTARGLTFDDGSSIFCHGVENSVFLTKLDSRGYKVWPGGYVVAHANDSSNFFGGGQIVSDGAYGAITAWVDYRGATFDTISGNYLNWTFYGQHVAANGTVQWQSGGVRFLSPLSGSKNGRFITDGNGGIIFIGNETGFGYPGAPNWWRLFAVRLNRYGQKLWERTIDSSTSQQLPIYLRSAVRAGKNIYTNYYKYVQLGSSIDLTIIIDTTGAFAPNPLWTGYRENVVLGDSVLFSRTGDAAVGNQVTKFGSDGDSLWTSFIPPATGTGCRFLTAQYSMLPSEDGGVYYLRVCSDSMYFLDQTGQLLRRHFPNVTNMAGFVFGDGSGGLVLATESGFAQRYNSQGTPLWGGSAPIIYRSDPQDVYFPMYWGDNNGGIIATFWTTTRGLCVQHTGRYGSPGVVPVAERPPIPELFALYQNYPNPFNPETRIGFRVSGSGRVSLKVFDVLGREVLTLVDEAMQSGDHQVTLDASGLASGMYFYRLNAGMYVNTKKLVVLK